MSRYIKIDGCRGCLNYMISKHQCGAVLHSKKCPATGIPYWCPLPVLKEEESDGAEQQD